MSLTLSETQRLFCKALSNGQANASVQATMTLRQKLGDEQVFALAKTHQVASIIAHNLITFQAENTPVHWTRIYEEIHARICAYLSELDRIASRLADEGIPIVALKNAGIARGIYHCPGCVPMGDLDTLVSRQHFCRAHNILETEGYRISAPNPTEIADVNYGYRTGGSEYSKMLPDGTLLWFELQWRPVAGRWLRPDQEPAADELIARSIPVPDTVVRILSPEDNLLQVALHTAKHSYVRAPGFRLHLDVNRIVRYTEIDWDLFLQQVLRYQVSTPVYFSLLLPYILFETPIPENILEQLAPSTWKRKLILSWLQRAGIFNPDGRKFSNPTFMIFHALLYEDIGGVLRALLPTAEWMKDRYGFEQDYLLPYYHIRRVLDLVFRRVL